MKKDIGIALLVLVILTLLIIDIFVFEPKAKILTTPTGRFYICAGNRYYELKSPKRLYGIDLTESFVESLTQDPNTDPKYQGLRDKGLVWDAERGWTPK